MYLHSIPTGSVDPCIGVRRPPLSSSFFPRPRPPPLLTPTLFFPRRKRDEDGESFSIGCPLVSSSSSPPSLRHFTSAACSTSTGSGHFEGPREMKTSPAFALFAKLPIFEGNEPSFVLVSTDPSPNYFHFIAGNSSLRRSLRPPSSPLSSSSDILSLSLSLERHILHTS